MRRILCPEPHNFSPVGLSIAATFADLTATPMSQTEFESQAVYYDAVLVRFTTEINKNILRADSKVSAVLSPTTGLDHIDLQSARDCGVKVYHLKGQTSFLEEISATAELTIALMLCAFRQLPLAVDSAKAGNWTPSRFMGRELNGKSLGIIGYGRLGKKVGRIAMALGMKVAAYDTKPDQIDQGVQKMPDLSTLLSQADVISLHVPLSEDTHHLISNNEIDIMKDGATIVNTSRGGIINSEALLDALESGKISAAALDVLENEKDIKAGASHPLIAYAKYNDNLIITPHIGGITSDSVEKTDKFILNWYFSEQGT